MEIDIQTTILILGGSHLIQVLFFFYQYITNKNIKGPGWWMMWSIAETLGYFLILRMNTPSIQPYGTIIQGMLLVSGTLCIYIGVMRFFDKKINLKFLVGFFVFFSLIHLYFILVHADVARTMTVSGSISGISFVTAVSIYKFKTPATAHSGNLNAAIGLIHGTLFAYRTIMMIPGAQNVDFLLPTLSNSLHYTEAFFVGLLWTFGFIIMLNQKLNSEISEAKFRFELIFNASPDAVIISRLNDGLFVDCNETFTRATGYTKEDIAGRSSLDIQLWKDHADRSRVTNMLNETGFCENQEVIFQRKGGDVFTGLLSARIITISGTPHILSYTRDISDRKKIEEEIRFKNEELKRVNIEKDKFFSIIAHDLRNPLSAFLGFTEIMVEELPGMTREELHIMAVDMRDVSANLFSLLENLLEWSRINRGLISFHPASVQLLQLVNESLSMVTDTARTKDIEIAIDIPADIIIYADSNAFRTVIRNLVSNAVKFTPSGGKIIISAKNINAESVEISVKDSGIGMSREMIDNLFKLDAQTNRKGTNGELSTGLGLILCKDFIEIHGGQIKVESEEGKGSVFYFTIPYMN